MASKQVKVTLVRGLAGLNERQVATVKGLGLRKRGSSSVLQHTPEVEGMIRKVSFMLTVEEMMA